MSNSNTTETIRQIVAAVLEVDPATIADNTDFVIELGADSLSVIEVMARLETVLGITIDQSQLARMTSVTAIVDIVVAAAPAAEQLAA